MIFDIYSTDRKLFDIANNRTNIFDKYDNVLVCTPEENNYKIEEYLPNIEILYYYRSRQNPKTDFSNMPNLKILYLFSQCTISNITGVNNLEELYLKFTKIKQMQYLPNLKLFLRCPTMSEDIQVLTDKYHENKGDLNEINEIMTKCTQYGC